MHNEDESTNDVPENDESALPTNQGDTSKDNLIDDTFYGADTNQAHSKSSAPLTSSTTDTSCSAPPSDVPLAPTATDFVPTPDSDPTTLTRRDLTTAGFPHVAIWTIEREFLLSPNLFQ